MGIIQRQGTKNAVVNYIGVVIAAISTLFIYPLDKELYGFAQFLYSTAYFLVPFASIGTIALAVKYFPRFKEDHRRHHGFFPLLVLLSLLGFGTFLILSWIFKVPLLTGLTTLGLDASLLESYAFEILLLCLTLMFALLISQYISNFHRIVVPGIVKDLGYKLFLPIIFLLCYLGWISQDDFALGIIFFFVIVSIILLLYLRHLKQLNFKTDLKFLSKSLKRGMASFMAFGSLNSFGSNLSLRIDSIMIPVMVGLSGNGIYNILLFMANVIEIPTRAINQISAPVISNAWEEDDTVEIKSVYRKSSINLLIVGGFIFLLLWFGLEPLFELSPKSEDIIQAKYVFLFLGIGKLIDMAGGVNNHIITYSKKYKYNLAFLLILGMSNLILNYYLIGKYGITGAAIATALSLVLFNLLKYLFIWRVWGIQPFSVQTLKLLMIFALNFLLLQYLSFNFHPILELILFLLILGICYLIPVYVIKISKDLNHWLHSFILSILKRR